MPNGGNELDLNINTADLFLHGTYTTADGGRLSYEGQHCSPGLYTGRHMILYSCIALDSHQSAF